MDCGLWTLDSGKSIPRTLIASWVQGLSDFGKYLSDDRGSLQQVAEWD